MYDDDYGLRDAYDDDCVRDPRDVHGLLYVCGYVYDHVPRDACAPHGDDDVHDDRDDAYDRGRAYVPPYARDHDCETHDGDAYDVDDAPRDGRVCGRVHDDAYGLPCDHACDVLCVRVHDDDDDSRFPYDCDDDDVH